MTRPGTTAFVRQDGTGAPMQADDGELFWMEVTYRAVDGTPMIAYVSCRSVGLRNGAMQTFLHLAPEPSYAAQSAAVDALLESYSAPTLDLDRLDQGTRPEPAP